MPGSRVSVSQGRGPVSPQTFYIPYQRPPRYIITGLSEDSTGAPLGSCQVLLFSTADKVLRAESISDANGNYLVDGTLGVTYWINWYKAGSPDVAGTSVNTLIATPA